MKRRDILKTAVAGAAVLAALSIVRAESAPPTSAWTVIPLARAAGMVS